MSPLRNVGRLSLPWDHQRDFYKRELNPKNVAIPACLVKCRCFWYDYNVHKTDWLVLRFGLACHQAMLIFVIVVFMVTEVTVIIIEGIPALLNF